MKKFFCFLFLVAWAVQSVYAPSVTLAWDPSPSPEVTWYRIYYGPASGVYTNTVQVDATNTTAVVTNLVKGALYFFMATAGTADGLESEPSNEINYTVPPGTNNINPPTGTDVEPVDIPLEDP